MSEGNNKSQRKDRGGFPAVVTVNVGGEIYTTSLATLRRWPDTRLAARFSGNEQPMTDKQGRVFLDRDGKLFRHVLNFLREPTITPAVYGAERQMLLAEARHFGLTRLTRALEALPDMTREEVLDRVSRAPRTAGSLLKTGHRARVELSKLSFRGLDFEFCDLSNCNFRHCDFTDCKLRGTRFDSCDLTHATFEGAEIGIQRAGLTHFSDAALEGTGLSEHTGVGGDKQYFTYWKLAARE